MLQIYNMQSVFQDDVKQILQQEHHIHYLNSIINDRIYIL